MKRRGFSWWGFIGLLALLFVLAAVLFPVFARRGSTRSNCQSNLKQIGLGIMQYVQDYNERFPRAALGGGSYGWANALQPYVKSTQLFQCSMESTPPNDANPHATGYTDYWFNRRLSSVSVDKVPATALTIELGDGNDGSEITDARYSLSQLPAEWLNDKNSPAYRHLDGANYAFADGHVKWLEPHKIVASPNNGPSFAIKE